jgi:hypothetical protein
MTHRRLHLSCALLLLLSAFPLFAQPPASAPGSNDPGPLNFNSVAILRWYSANLTTTFPVGNQPWGAAFDGQNIWVFSCANCRTKEPPQRVCLAEVSRFDQTEVMGLRIHARWLATSRSRQIVRATPNAPSRN